MQIGEKIAQLRKKKNLTQKELGDMCNVNRITISNYELCRQSPTVDTLEAIAIALDVSILTFFIKELESYTEVSKELTKSYVQSLVVEYRRSLTILPCVYLVRVKNIFDMKEIVSQFSDKQSLCEIHILSKDLNNLGAVVNAINSTEYDLVVFTDSATHITDEITNKSVELKGVFQ